MTAPLKLKRKARGERPYFFADPNVDRVIAMVMGLAGEVAVMRDRLDTLERLLERTGALQRADIESYRPEAEVVAERSAWREAFLAEVLRIVEIEVEALATGDTERYDSAISLVEAGTPAAPARKSTSRKAPARAAAKKKATARPAQKKPVAKKPARKKAAPKKAVARRKTAATAARARPAARKKTRARR